LKIYSYLVSDELTECAAEVAEQINQWNQQQEKPLEFVNTYSDETSEDEWKVGLTAEVKRLNPFKKALLALYKIAEDTKQDFVIGFVNESKQREEDVCYFGYNEGKPDPLEIATYLNIRL